MKVVKAERVNRTEPGDWYVALIVSETEPSASTVTGADVDGMNDDDRLAAGSVILTPSSNWVAFSDGEFSAKG